MVHAKGARIRVRGLQPAQVLAGLAGIAFLVVGIIGFTRTGLGNFSGHHDAGFWRFSGNPLTSLVRVVTGVVGLLLAFGSGRARLFGWLLFLGYGALFVWGLMIDGMISTNPFANAGNPMDLRPADTWLHLGVAALGLLIAVLPARRGILLPEEEAEPEPATVAEPEPAGHRSFFNRRRAEATEEQPLPGDEPRRGFLRRAKESGSPQDGRRHGLAH